MIRCAIFSLVYLTLFKYVFSLDCYFSDIRNLKTQGPNATAFTVNCNRYYEGQGINPGNNLRCATVVADTDQFTMKYLSCLSSGSTCDYLINMMKNQALYDGVVFNKIECHECNGNLCNGGPEKIAEAKSELRNSLVVWICVLLSFKVLAVLTAVSYYMRRKKQNAIANGFVRM